MCGLPICFGHPGIDRLYPVGGHLRAIHRLIQAWGKFDARFSAHGTSIRERHRFVVRAGPGHYCHLHGKREAGRGRCSFRIAGLSYWPDSRIPGRLRRSYPSDRAKPGNRARYAAGHLHRPRCSSFDSDIGHHLPRSPIFRAASRRRCAFGRLACAANFQ